ncbi:MAG TPA: ornithine carbamoyltransferase [Candidatus Limnocylindrales bacterium]|nr:ornithine carbamoyltransferase [Candidatus Limnocylindrales bacterium]
MKRDLLSFADLTRAEADRIFATAARLKADLRAGRRHVELAGRSLALIFHKPSLRTRVSFEVAMTQLGGTSIFITDREIGMGSREPVQDVARVLSGYVDGIMIRTFDHQIAVNLARFAAIPVVNGLTDWLHPCQILADLLTMIEHGLELDDATVAYIGDGNNVANSWIEAAGLYGLTLRIACPEGYDPDMALVAQVRNSGKGRVEIVRSAEKAAEGADVLYTDVWASMGQEAERETRLPIFRPFQINTGLLQRAKPNALVLHCLPAHRGEEITEEVIEGPNSGVFDQAENRLHVQKAVLYELMVPGAGAGRAAGRATAPRRGAAKGPARPARRKGAAARRNGSAPRRARGRESARTGKARAKRRARR